MDANVPIGHQAEIDRFYDLLERRAALISTHYNGRMPTSLELPQARTDWRTKGVYFFFENGEHRAKDTMRRSYASAVTAAADRQLRAGLFVRILEIGADLCFAAMLEPRLFDKAHSIQRSTKQLATAGRSSGLVALADGRCITILSVCTPLFIPCTASSLAQSER
jgi:hypothetical protein